MPRAPTGCHNLRVLVKMFGPISESGVKLIVFSMGAMVLSKGGSALTVPLKDGDRSWRAMSMRDVFFFVFRELARSLKEALDKLFE